MKLKILFHMAKGYKYVNKRVKKRRKLSIQVTKY